MPWRRWRVRRSGHHWCWCGRGGAFLKFFSIETMEPYVVVANKQKGKEGGGRGGGTIQQRDGCGVGCGSGSWLDEVPTNLSNNIEEEEEEPYLRVKCMFVRCPTYLYLYPCTLPTAPVSRSFGLRSSYEIAILDTDQRPTNKSLRLLNQFKLSKWMSQQVDPLPPSGFRSSQANLNPI